ncbi:hypothetical protein IQ269_03655 [Tychonema sp. LEGE 07199]|nr:MULTISPECIES: hypothetical protein [unclassified Tychonema]MBE9119923.1 hypothetical protein [Tychonema sp. LEGE 07199]MBE9130807.1 hypothetical protein [Tychonema sp. LEGE 07196]
MITDYPSVLPSLGRRKKEEERRKISIFPLKMRDIIFNFQVFPHSLFPN